MTCILLASQGGQLIGPQVSEWGPVLPAIREMPTETIRYASGQQAPANVGFVHTVLPHRMPADGSTAACLSVHLSKGSGSSPASGDYGHSRRKRVPVAVGTDLSLYNIVRKR